MKTIRVVAAIMIDNGKVFATQRGYGEFKDGWEFPGGKIDAGETPEEALVREIKEELDTVVEVKEFESVTINWTDFLGAYTMNLYKERKFNDDVREKTT